MDSKHPSKPTKPTSITHPSTIKPSTNKATPTKPSSTTTSGTKNDKNPPENTKSSFPNGATPYIMPFDNKDHWKIVLPYLTSISQRKGTLDSF